MFRPHHPSLLAVSSVAAVLLLGTTSPAGAVQEVPDGATAEAVQDLSGTVTAADGRPLEGIEVRVAGRHTLTDETGHWTLDVPEGRHLVLVAPDPGLATGPVGWFPEYYPAADRPEQASAVTVRDGAPVAGLDVTLEPAGRITGDVQGGLPPHGPPMPPRTDIAPGWEVYTPRGALVLRRPSPGTGDNTFSFLIRPGTYKLLMSGTTTDGQSRRYLPQWHRAGDGPGVSTLEAATAITVGAGETVADVRTEVAYGMWARRGATPQVVGTPRVGRQVRVTRGDYNLMTGNTYAYRWQRAGRTVGTGPTYRLRRADLGGALTVTVRAANRGFSVTTTQQPTVQRRRR